MAADTRTRREAEIENLVDQTDKRRAGVTRLESRDGCYAAIELAKAEPALRLRLDDLDAHQTWRRVHD